MNEQLLKDFVATAEYHNYDWETVFSKFPELQGYDQQALKDYAATAKYNNYDFGITNSKFPEFNQAPQQEEPGMIQSAITYVKGLFDQSKEDEFDNVGQVIPDALKKKEEQGSTELPSEESSSALPSSPNAATTFDNNKSYFSELLGNISKELLDEDEDIVAKRLQEKLRPYGVTVDQARVGREAVSLTIGQGDNAKTIEVPVDNFFGDNDQESSDKIKSWLAQNIDRSIIDEQEEAHKFNKGFTSKQDFNKSLNEINSSLTTKDEEIVVPRLTNMFEDYGFKFKEVGAGDYVEVTAPNGKKKTVPIDRSFNFNMMGGISIDTEGKGNAEAANELRSFIDANKPKIENEVSQYDKYYKRYRNQKEVDEAYKSIGEETSSLISDKKSLAADIVKLRAEEEELRKNPDAVRLNALAQRKQDIINRTILVQEKEASNKMNEAKLDEAVGKYTRNAENEGTWYGLTANTFTEGTYGIGAGTISPIAYINAKSNALISTIKMAATGKMSFSDAWQMNNAFYNIADYEKTNKELEKGKEFLKENVEFEVSEAYKKKAEENFAARNALGIVGFLPAMAASTVNPTAGYTAFFATGYDGAMEEMRANPAFENVSIDEKAGLATALGFVNAAIMKYNPTGKITNEFLESSFGKSVMQNVLKKMGSETSAKTIQEFTENEVRSAINRGLIKTGENLAHGFGMGVELKVSGDAIKYVYNQTKENTSYSINGKQMNEDDFKNAVSKMSKEDLQSASIETQNPSSSVADMLKSKAKDAGLDGTAMINETQMFQLPTNAADYLYQVAESGLDMAVGSAIMGSVKSLGTAYKENNFNGVSDEVIDNYRLLSIPEFRKAHEKKLEIQVANGEITEAQKNADINDVDMSIGVLNKVPDNYTAAQKRKAFSLIREREILEQGIEGKDKSLVKKESERIKQINAELEDVSNQATETPAPAEAPAEAKPVLEKDEEGNFVPKKYSISASGENPAPEISETAISDESFGGDKPDNIKRVKLLEVRGRNSDGKTVGTVLIQLEGGESYTAEVKFNDAELEKSTAPAKAPAKAPAEPTAKPKTLDEIKDEDLKNNLLETLDFFENSAKKEKEGTNKAAEKLPFFLKPFGKLAIGINRMMPASINIEKYYKQKAEQIKNNPEQFINDEIAEYEKIKEKKGEDFKDEGYLNYLKEQQSKIQEENAIQEPTTEEGVLRTEQPQVELPTVGEGNAKGETTQEGVTPAKPEEALKDVESTTKALDKSKQLQIDGEEVATILADIEAETIEDAIAKYEIKLESEELSSAEEKEINDKLDFLEQAKAVQSIESSKLFIDNVANQMPERGVIGGVLIKGENGESLGETALKTVDNNTVEISDFNSAEAGQRKGTGLRALKVLTDIADKTGTTLKLFPSPIKLLEVKGLTKEKIINFYEKGGFKLNKTTGMMEYIPESKSPSNKDISEAYHKAKTDGSNPELVKAVEDLLGKPKKAKAEVDELLDLDTKDQTNLGKVYDFLDKIDNDLSEELGGNKLNDATRVLPLATIKVVVKALKALVKGGMTLQDAITKVAADNKISFDDVVKSMKILAEKVSPGTVRGYNKMMEDVNSEILRGLDRKTKETTIEKNVMKIVESSEAYKNATDQQREQIVRDVKEAFGEKMKQGPSAETITGKKEKEVTVNEAQALKDQIKLEIKAAKEGASSVREAVKKIRDFVVKNKDVANLTRKDLLKVIDIIKNVKDEKTLESASKKITDIIDKANKDIIEVSKTKMEAQRTKAELKANKEKMKAEIKAAKEGAKGVVNKVKAIKKYFDSVKEYGNLTRRDLLKVMAEIAKVKNEETLDKAVDKINDIIDNAKTDVLEISELKMIKQTIKEIKSAKKNIKDKRKLIVDVIENIKKSGKLAASQVNGLLKRANNLNVENFEQVAKFIDYAEKIFTDADYQNKLSKGSALRDSIKNLSKNKSKKYDGNLVKLGEEFNKIDPSLVEDIEQYNKIASELEQAIKGSSMNGFKPTVEIKAVDAYIEEMMTSQKEKLTEIMREQIEELLGVDGSKFTYDEMMELIQESKEEGAEEKQKLSEENEKTVRTTAVKWFESLSSTIEHILKTGKDPFTGEPVDIKESKQKVVRNFMEMDLTKMDIRDAVRAVDALNNFMVNQSTAKMERVFRKYRTERRIEFLLENKITSKAIKVFRSKWFGRGLLREFASETILMDALFGGTGKATMVSDAMGLLGIKSNKSKAQKIVRTMVADYVTEFYKKKANGVEFNTAENNAERGILAFVSRMEIGNEKTSFEDRKSLVEQSIENLREGSEKEQEKARIYQEVYDKILKDSKSAEEVRKKVDKINAKAVDFWVEKWAENYEELADVSENIHNVILGRDGYYTPDVVRRVEEYKDKKASEEDVLDMNDSAFLHNSGIIQKKSGRLEKSTIKNKLPEGKYYDFAFDNNNASLMSDALIDVMTAGNVIELSTFLNSPNFKKIVTTSKERELLKERMQLMVRNFRNKGQYSNDEVSQLAKTFNRMNALGAGFVLGGVGAIPKQYLVPAINTMIASGGNRPHFDIWWNKSKQKFVNESGESVANRGVMSDADIKNIDNLLNEAAKSRPEKALRYIEAVNKIYLKAFLVNRDVAIAKASWLTYYEKGLRNQGFKTKDIDYDTHKLNKAAAQYATRMVDRQQNISDEDLRGKMYSRTEGYGPIVTKVLLPFASFRINQWLRMNTDLGIATSKTASKEDRKAAGLSLVATSAEIAMFNAVGFGISAGLHYGATSIKRAITGEGDEEDKEKLKEQDEKYMKNLKKGKGASLVQDFLSPLPIADPLFEGIVYNILDKLQSNKDEDDRINIFEPKPKELEGWLDWISKNSGGAGAIADRVNSFKKIAEAYISGKIETTNYGKTTEKNIRERDKKALGYLTTLSFLNVFGLLPTEGTTMQNAAFKEIVKSSSTKTEAEIIQDKANRAERRAEKNEKIELINQAITKAPNQRVADELMKMRADAIEDLSTEKKSDEEKEALKKKREAEKASYKNLLGGYDTKDDLKRYDPELYERNFGENSNYYKTHKFEQDAEKLLDKVEQKNKDLEYNYKKPSKRKSRFFNSDGTTKRKSYFKRFSSK